MLTGVCEWKKLQYFVRCWIAITYIWLRSPEKYAYIYLKWDSTHQSWWGGVLPYKRLMGMCRWVAFSRLESLQWGRIFNCWFSHELTKIQTKKLSILTRFYFHGALEQLKTNFHTKFRFKKVSWFCDRVGLNFYVFEWRGIYMTAERAFM